MIKNNKGITLLSLIITIVVMVILISIIGYFSIDSVKNSHIANEKKEFADMLQYVSTRKAKLLVDEFDVSENYNDSVITTEALYLVASGLQEDLVNRIIEVNSADYLADNYKYIYLTADKLKSESIATGNIVIKDAKSNYIVNFYTGTIIALYDAGERVEISGVVKGLSDIMDEIN